VPRTAKVPAGASRPGWLLRGRPADIDPFPGLLSDLRSPNRSARLEAYYRLLRFGFRAVEPLAQALNDPDAAVRRRAATALITLPFYRVSDPWELRRRVIANVIPALASPNPGTRAEAVELLGKFGADALAAGADLLGTLRDEDAHVRAAAACACARAGLDDRRVWDALAAALRGPDYYSAHDGLVGMLELLRPTPDVDPPDAEKRGQRLVAILPCLGRLTGHPDAGLRQYAAHLLHKINPPARESVRALRHLLSDPDKDVGFTAAVALADLAPAECPALMFRVLCQGLASESWRTRLDACQALRGVGPLPRPVLVALARVVEDDHDDVRFCAACLLCRHGQPSAAARAALIEGLASPANSGRFQFSDKAEGIDALLHLRCNTSEAVAALRVCLEDPAEDVRGAAASAIEAIRVRSKEK
jgi:HEAT repeat protein